MVKKILKVLGILIVFVVGFLVGGTVCSINMGMKEAAPLNYSEEDGYMPFYRGVYIGGEDLAAGSYDVVFNDIKNPGNILRFKNREAFYNIDFYDVNTILSGSKGFHINIADGEVISLEFDPLGEMKIKRIGDNLSK